MFSFQLFLVFLSFTFVTCAPGRHGKNVSGLGLPISNPDAKDIIPGQYIVVYNNNVTDDAVQIHQASVVTAMRKRGLEDPMMRMKAFSMVGWRAMALEAQDCDDGMIIDIANAAEV